MNQTFMKNNKQLVEIARSFSFKMNLGNFENIDFFCSQKAEVPIEEAEQKSEELYLFCKREVAKSISTYLKEHKKPTLAEKFTNAELMAETEEFQKKYETDTKLEEIRQEEEIAKEL